MNYGIRDQDTHISITTESGALCWAVGARLAINHSCYNRSVAQQHTVVSAWTNDKVVVLIVLQSNSNISTAILTNHPICQTMTARLTHRPSGHGEQVTIATTTTTWGIYHHYYYQHNIVNTSPLLQPKLLQPLLYVWWVNHHCYSHNHMVNGSYSSFLYTFRTRILCNNCFNSTFVKSQILVKLEHLSDARSLSPVARGTDTVMINRGQSTLLSITSATDVPQQTFRYKVLMTYPLLFCKRSRGYIHTAHT